MIGYVYGAGQKLSTQQELGLKVATPVGTLMGQLLFGWLADVVGRKRMYGVELSEHLLFDYGRGETDFEVIIIVSTFVQATSGSGPAVSIIGTLIIWRFIVSLLPDSSTHCVSFNVAGSGSRRRLSFVCSHCL